MSLSEKLHSNLELTSFPGEIPVNYLYTYGIAGEDFFRAIKDKGKFLASKCEKCGVTYFPSRIFCERCLNHIPSTFEVPGIGEVFSFTECHENMDGSRKEKPIIIAAIKMDGTDCVFVHFLGDVKTEDVFIGMKVEPVLKAKKDREGSIFDILHFKPSGK